MHDRTNECGVSIGTELLEETGKVERVKLFNNFIYTYKKDRRNSGGTLRQKETKSKREKKRE